MEGENGLVNMSAKKKHQKKAKAQAKAARPQKKAARAKPQRAAANPAKPQKKSAPQAEVRKPRCIVLAGFGLNAELELAHAFTLAGADCKIVHFSDISSGAVKLSDFEIFAIPGGWSFGDDIAGGRVLSNKLKNTFGSQFKSFVESGKPILGICNGFQTLVKLGALPNVSGAFSQESTLTFNKSGKFEDRWVYLKPQKSACKYFEGVEFIHCPVRHGEGQFVPRDSGLLARLKQQGMAVLCYTDAEMKENPGYPSNPNGSPLDIAGICDKTGKILGLMPHPECSVRRITFPRFTAGISFEKNSLRFFENIVKEGAKHI
jgi:phosphoribosylformylglycinamidine synthase subunit PurQ / glutaminase